MVKDTGDKILAVLGCLGAGAAIVGAAYLGVQARDSLCEEHSMLREQRDKLERRRMSSLTLGDMRRLKTIEARMGEIEDALGI